MRRIKRSEQPFGGCDSDGTVTLRFRLPRLPKILRRKHPTDTLPEPFGADLRALGPIHVCPCGSQVFNVMCAFEDYEIVWYFLDATCVNCGNLVVVPCSVDAE